MQYRHNRRPVLGMPLDLLQPVLLLIYEKMEIFTASATTSTVLEHTSNVIEVRCRAAHEGVLTRR